MGRLGKVLEIEATDWLSVAGGMQALSFAEKGVYMDLSAMCLLEGGSVAVEGMARKLRLTDAAFEKALASLKLAGVKAEAGRISIAAVDAKIAKCKQISIVNAANGRFGGYEKARNSSGRQAEASEPLANSGEGLANPLVLDVPPAPPSLSPEPPSEPDGSSVCPELGQAPAPGQRQKAKASKIVFDSTSGKFGGIPKSLLERWEKACPALDIEQELAKAGAWLIANPKNLKKNYARFLTNWLSKAQDRAPKIEKGATVFRFGGAGGGLKVVSKPGVKTAHGEVLSL
jgi:hypothetical protein